MKIKKQYLIPAILASAFVLMQNSLAIAGSKDVDEELSPYKWGHWDRMVPPAAGPVALAAPAVTAALPSTPDSVVPPPKPTPTPPEPTPPGPSYESPLDKSDTAPPSPSASSALLDQKDSAAPQVF